MYLVMLSGGLDSAYVGHLLLSAGERVHFHHIRLDNREGRAEVEAQAVEGVLDWYRQQDYRRKWSYDESAWSWPYRHVVKDVAVWSFMIGLVIQANPRIRTVAIPRHLDAFTSDVEARDAGRVRNGVVKMLLGRLPKWEYPIGGMTKAEIVAACPPDLFRVTWSCRRPVDGAACHECMTCRQIDEAVS